MHVEEPPEFHLWNESRVNGTAKWTWLSEYLPVQANGNRNLEITLQGEADNQKQADFKQALEAQYKVQRNDQMPPIDAGWDANLPGTVLPEGSDMGHGAEASGSTQPKTGMDGETGGGKA